jgi:hypothetical protein
MRTLICKVGRYAGDRIAYPDHIAQMLLDAGRAELPPEDRDPPAAEVATAPDAAEKRTLPEPRQARRRRRRASKHTGAT